MRKKVICVTGPTAVGKSDLAIAIAGDFSGEIINGDSIQIYRQLNVASAKSTIQEQNGIRHHLLDYKDVGDDYSVAHFQHDARLAIEDITSRGKLPVVAGGTGLYIKALLYDYDFLETGDSADEETFSSFSNEELYEKLKVVDEKTAEGIHPNNRKRVIRALKMAQAGVLKSLQEENQKHEMIYDAFIIGLTMDRKKLHERISLRVDRMLQQGLLEEVTGLFEKYPSSAKGLDGIGYKEFVPYFSGEKSIAEVLEDIKTHTRQFAKRQYTWFNHQMPVHWYDVSQADYRERIYEDIRSFLD
ncbi:MAG: tRNA (adenosine(37)-N6)-dimethylallyltransferase MiaA, partial [Erysipelotrichaceae bacterium]|nr:tRNA (adenosine(37)-N6)-dimethylallyltransferase MiaA [Erysipelotrichaceae bacterium]